MFSACGAQGDGTIAGAGGHEAQSSTGFATGDSSSHSSSATGSGPDCTVDGITAQLAAAKPGTTVALGTCMITGSFTVPTGVTLSGLSKDMTVITGEQGKPALTLMPGGGSQPTSVKNLAIISHASAGIIAKGMGGVTLDTVMVNADGGMGIGIDGASPVVLNAVDLIGPVTAGNADGVDYPAPFDKTAPYGLVLRDVAGTGNTLSNVTAKGFADYGALFVKSNLSWSGGNASNNLGTGLMIVGGTVTLDTVDLSDNIKGKRPLQAYGAVFTDHVTGVVETDPVSVTSTNLKVTNNAGIGVLHDGAQVTAKHTGLVGQKNALAAVWVQGGAQTFELDNAQIDQTIFAGFVAIDTKNITVNGGLFKDATAATLPGGPGQSAVTVGDGIHIIRSTNVDIENASVSGNARSGLLFDLGTLDVMTSNLKFVGVNVLGAPNGFGALCQRHQNGQFILLANGVGGWDTGIMRDIPATNADKNVLGPMEIGGVIGPDIIPAPFTVIKGGLPGTTGP